ncbi:MAG TPA: late competence development ComFB family protein [Marinobacter sp.]|nr:late competence development ComFB family protein [Marinobacter sp.]
MSLRDAIDNFYERLVLDAIDATRQDSDTADYLTDVMCVALNRLPARYYRHSIDMMFYLADEELKDMKEKSLVAVRQARDFVKQHQRDGG